MGIALLIPAVPAFSEGFDELIPQWAKQFRAMESLEFTSRSKCSFLATADNTPPLEKTLSFKGRGEKFEFEFNQSGGSEPSPIYVHRAFDGTHLQIALGNQLQITAKRPDYVTALDGDNGFLKPYQFIRLLKLVDINKLPSLFVSLSDLVKMDVWATATKDAKNIHFEESENRKYMVATFSGAYHGMEAEMTVWFSLAQAGFPMKWQLQLPQIEKYHEEYEVTDLQREEVKGQILYYPKAAKWRQYRGDGRARTEAIIEVSNLKINKLADDDVFTLDPISFNSINDLDAHAIIRVPK